MGQERIQFWDGILRHPSGRRQWSSCCAWSAYSHANMHCLEKIAAPDSLDHSSSRQAPTWLSSTPPNFVPRESASCIRYLAAKTLKESGLRLGTGNVERERRRGRARRKRFSPQRRITCHCHPIWGPNSHHDAAREAAGGASPSSSSFCAIVQGRRCGRSWVRISRRTNPSDHSGPALENLGECTEVVQLEAEVKLFLLSARAD